MSTVSSKLGVNPTNNVLFPVKVPMFAREASLREIKCQCGTVLAAILLEGMSEADFIWPWDVVCCEENPPLHWLVEKGSRPENQTAKVTCYGRHLFDYEAKEVLKAYL